MYSVYKVPDALPFYSDKFEKEAQEAAWVRLFPIKPREAESY